MSTPTNPNKALLEKGDPTRTAAVTIVDDDAHTLFFVRLIINEAMPQAEVVCFNSPRRAFEYISRIGSDLLITDHGMGAMSGTDLIMQLRAEALSLSVIMISNDTSTRAEALAAGACEFLSKEELNKRARAF